MTTMNSIKEAQRDAAFTLWDFLSAQIENLQDPPTPFLSSGSSDLPADPMYLSLSDNPWRRLQSVCPFPNDCPEEDRIRSEEPFVPESAGLHRIRSAAPIENRRTRLPLAKEFFYHGLA